MPAERLETEPQRAPAARSVGQGKRNLGRLGGLQERLVTAVGGRPARTLAPLDRCSPRLLRRMLLRLTSSRSPMPSAEVDGGRGLRGLRGKRGGGAGNGLAGAPSWQYIAPTRGGGSTGAQTSLRGKGEMS